MRNKQKDFKEKQSFMISSAVFAKGRSTRIVGVGALSLLLSAGIASADSNEPLPIVGEKASVAQQTTKKITGTILDAAGLSVIGANVVEKGTTNGTITDIDGNFSLEVAANATLVVSYIGYNSQEVPVAGKTKLDVVLTEDSQMLNEVVVVGFGTQKKVNVTGAVAMVSSDELEGIPASNMTSMLQGKLPGVNITQSTGQPGAEGTSIRIRGIGTMNNASPMVIVDGLEGDMNDLNPADIESVSVLKDAAAAAIYGTRAANGVILITTKRGSNDGGVNVSYNGYFGVQDMINVQQPLNSYDFAMLTNEAYRNQGGTPTYSEKDLQLFKDGTSPDTHPNTDWIGLLMSESGFVHNHNISLSGGSKSNRYAISLGYYDQGGLIKNTDYDRYNVRINTDIDITEKLKFGITSTMSYGNRRFPMHSTSNVANTLLTTTQTGMGELFSSLQRFSSAVVNKYSTGEWGSYSGCGSPVSAALEGSSVKDLTARVSGSSFLEYEIIDGLKIKGLAGVNYANKQTKSHFKEMEFYGGEVIGPNIVKDISNRDLDITLQAFLNYNKTFGDHTISAMLGVSRESMSFNQLTGYRRNLPSGDLTDLNAGATDGQVTTGYSTQQTIGSYFGRVNYDYKGKYLLEANVRRDGSSKFGSGHKWGTFPSFSAGWRLSEEEFMKDLEWLDNLKVRGSWGQLGNHNIGSYIYMQLLNVGQTLNSNNKNEILAYPFSDGLITGVSQNKANNPDISWETTTEYNVGVDATLWNGLLNFTFDYYNRYTKDILTVVPVSLSYGLDAPTTNSGAMSNKGIEISLGHRNTIGDFTYNLNGYITNNKNNVETFENPSISNRIKKEGIPWNSYYGYECIGKFMNEEELATEPTHNKKVGVGDLKFKDQNNDGKINGADRVVLGSETPNITYGLNLELGYKGFSLLANFQGVADAYREYAETKLFAMVKGDNAYEMHLDRAIVENGVVVKDGFFPRTLIEHEHNVETSSFTVMKTDYLRLKNLQLGYTFPTKMMESFLVKNLRVYLSGTNLFTIDSLPVGLDPENNWQNYPQVSFYTLGVDIKF